MPSAPIDIYGKTIMEVSSETYLSLFSGIGGLDLAAHWAGFSPVAFVEQDSFCQKVLAKHWPGTPIFDDVRTFNATQFLGITLICGGFPCQDISVAGKGAGLQGERSGLWFEYLRIIKECQPRFVVAENVDALLGRGLDRVLCDMEEAGYAVEALSVAASDLGAPHQRKRWFIVGERIDEPGVAQGDSCGGRLPGKPRRGAGSEPADGLVGGEKRAMPNPDSQRQPQSKGLISDQRRRPEHGGEELGDPSDDGCHVAQNASGIDQRGDQGSSWQEFPCQPARPGEPARRVVGISPEKEMADPKLPGTGCESGEAGGQEREPSLAVRLEPETLRQAHGTTCTEGTESDGGNCELADSLGHGRQEQRGDGSGGDFLSPFGACGGGSTVSRMGGAAHGLSCGMDFPGLLWPAGKGPYQHDWEAARTVKGKQPGRPARIKALGNAVVPSQALPVFIAIRQRIEETKASTNRFGMLEIED